MTTLYVDNIAPNLQSKISAPNLQLPSGSVVQVVQTVKTDVFSSSAQNTFTDITGLNATITPSSASSKILVLVELKASMSSAAVTSLRLLRGSTPIGNGDSAGSRTPAASGYYSGASDIDAHIISATINHLDSPNTTDATTYKVQVSPINAVTVWINKTARDNDSVGWLRTSSTITLMEIAG